MGPASCLWQMIIIAMLLADSKSCLNITSVTGMRSSQVDIELHKKQSNFQPLEGNMIHAASSNRRLALAPGEGSSEREVEALIAFKNSVTTDPFGALKSWIANESDACGWIGVKCSTLSKNVAHLDLSNLGLIGIVPQMLGSLNYVEYIDLSNNFLSGSIPNSIANCSNLSYLNISLNQVTGEIPSQIGKLSHLLALDVEQNNLTGLIPDAVGNCSKLEFLYLGNNYLGGAIPLTVGKLSSLKKLRLHRNILSGTIPGTLGNCSHLTHLSLNENYQLVGEIPEELSLLEKLEVFYVCFCHVVGDFPIWITNFTSLAQLELCGNILSGHIPEEIGKLSETLTSLVLFSNQFSGPIPQAVVNCSGLVWLEYSENQMTGNIPQDIGFLSNLEILSLTNNNISGLIPPSTSNCSALKSLEPGYNPMSRQRILSWIPSLANLQYLFLAEMNLYGEVPASLGQLSSLLELSMYFNNLGGVLPTSLGNLSLLSRLDLGSNQFQGEIPVEITGNQTSLTVLQLSENFFVGSLPDLSNLNELTSLFVDRNLFTGTIDSSNIGMGTPLLNFLGADANPFSGHLPDGIGNLSNLQVVSLAYNRFSGSIPPLWGNLTNLGFLHLAGNNLEGTFPVDLTSCTQLVVLDLSFNKFKDLIPHQIGQLVNLETLNFNGNSMSGSIPSSFSNFTKLGILNLGFNSFSGVLYGSVLSRMTSLTQVVVCHNSISGSLPLELHLLTDLQYLDVSANNLLGSIQSGLAACIGLAYLDVSLNNFTGIVPPDLGLLRHLEFFNASGNNFDGPIPTAGLFLSPNINKSSFLGNPGLCGSNRLVSQKCSKLIVSDHHHCKSFGCRRVWVPVVVSVSTFVLLGIVIIYRWVSSTHEETGQNLVTAFTFQGRIVLKEQEVMTIIDGGRDSLIGMGAKSTVYKGVLSEGEIFALKVLQNEDVDDNGKMDKTETLLREVRTVAQLRHVNIIKVLGLSVTPTVKALILEYMPRGSLHDNLHGKEEVSCKLSHQERFKIILGIAEALVYLHHSFHEPIIHRDLKPSNILLGMDLEPKLADFGISKFAKFQRQGELEASASSICGTFGYMPPEYAFQSTVSAKGDVYGFGVILLELLTGRKPASESSSMTSGDLVEFVLGSFKEKPFELLDSTLMKEATDNLTTKEQLMLLLRVGVLCTKSTPKSRPNMNDVLGMLMQIKDVGSEIRTLKTVDVLANEITIWDPDSAQQLGDQVASSSS